MTGDDGSFDPLQSADGLQQLLVLLRVRLDPKFLALLRHDAVKHLVGLRKLAEGDKHLQLPGLPDPQFLHKKHSTGGHMDFAQFKTATQEIQLQLDDGALKRLFVEADKEGRGHLDKAEFKGVWA